ncbi:MAG: Stp1/IreP family PP2C-type Ser/Thr phosphatase [Pyrinomonadaceae bacterium]
MLETRKIDLTEGAIKIVASIQTDPGCVREANEDSGRHVSPGDDVTRITKGTLTIVADGMGGHASGEVASQMAVELISEFYYADAQMPAGDALQNAIEQANAEIYYASTSDEQYFGMGTTVIALALLGDTAISAHVGDSRLYRMRNRSLEMLTLDHSQVMEMVKHGVLSLEEARDHEDKNVILRAVGTQPSVEVEVSDPFAVEFGDLFLLCSDGLSDMLEDIEIEAILNSEANAHDACERLIAEAKNNGGHDNITVGIVSVGVDAIMGSRGSVRVTREVEALV